MADASSLWPVMVGGGLAILGGIVGSVFNLATKLLDRNTELRKRREERFQKMVRAVYEYDHWVETMGRKVAFGEEVEPGLSPIAELESLAAVNFPELLGAIASLQAAFSRYRVWMYESAQHRVAGELAKRQIGLEAAYKPYLESRDALLAAIRTYARQEFK